ncbi:MAG TPA: 50S ribosomal protein L35 [Phycisphaerae bacterium]
MPKVKMKTHKGIAKRVKVTARGKVKYKSSMSGHLMSSKSGDRGRRLRRRHYVQDPLATRLKLAIGDNR